MGMRRDIFFSDSLSLKPREKAKALGISSLSDAELIALLLDTGTKGENVVRMSERILFEKGGLIGLFSSRESELNVKGVKTAKAYRLLSVCEIMRRINLPVYVRLESSKDVFEKTKGYFIGKKEEVLLVLFLSRNREVLRREEVSFNERDKVPIPFKKILRVIFDVSASYVVLVHNHPSGNVNPSQNDILGAWMLSDNIKESGAVLLDSIVVSDIEYYSMSDDKLGPFGDLRGKISRQM